LVPNSPEDAFLKPVQAILELQLQSISSIVDSALRHSRVFDSIAEGMRNVVESAERWEAALTIVQAELPKRGWYITGHEPAILTGRLGVLILEEKWHELDDCLMEQASKLPLKVDVLFEWLAEKNVLQCCIERVRIFLDARSKGDHEIATLVGVPLIDELSRALYGGRDFTTKRKRQPKPGMACSTSSDAARCSDFCKGFVSSFGLIHEDVDPSKLENPDYFNRSAIVHGMMRRGYGPKDSAKAFMAIMFIVFAMDDPDDP
jgi:hypothetical protein